MFEFWEKLMDSYIFCFIFQDLLTFSPAHYTNDTAKVIDFGRRWFYPHIINTGTQVPIVTQSSMEYLESTTLGLTYPLAPEGAFFIGKSKSTNNVVPCIINTFWNTIRPISSICCSKVTRNKIYSPKYTFLHYKSFLLKN